MAFSTLWLTGSEILNGGWGGIGRETHCPDFAWIYWKQEVLQFTFMLYLVSGRCGLNFQKKNASHGTSFFSFFYFLYNIHTWHNICWYLTKMMNTLTCIYNIFLNQRTNLYHRMEIGTLPHCFLVHGIKQHYWVKSKVNKQTPNWKYVNEWADLLCMTPVSERVTSGGEKKTLSLTQTRADWTVFTFPFSVEEPMIVASSGYATGDRGNPYYSKRLGTRHEAASLDGWLGAKQPTN